MPEDTAALARECESSAHVLQRSFDDLDAADLKVADLILVDFNLSNWPNKDRAAEVTLCPQDGLAVAEILRSRYRCEKSNRPVAFAVLSGDLASLTHPLPTTSREHLVANLAKVEWAFQKENPIVGTARQLLSLAHAVRQLPKAWPQDSNTMKDRTVHELLAVPNGNWSSIAASDVSKCHPPIQELSTWSHGIAFVRWMLRRILPYPTFLLDDARAALRLGMSLESFDRAFKEQERFQIWLESALYCGMLWDFLGRRWWKVGIDSLLWDLTQEQPFGKDLIRKAIREKAPDAVFLTEENPVACVGKEYKFERIGEAEQCVRLRPDDWPLFADSAWAARTTVAADQSFLMAVEDESDRAELETESQ